MTQWDVEHGDLLDSSAEAIVCSANPNLNLSGGVGGALALRFGDEMQQWLRTYLRGNGLRHVSPGDAIVAPSCGTPFSAVAHAVAIDVFYDTSAELVLAAYQNAFTQLAERSCRTVAAACLGCGYGRLSNDEFSQIAQRLSQRPLEGIERVVLTTTNADLAAALKETLAAA